MKIMKLFITELSLNDVHLNPPIPPHLGLEKTSGILKTVIYRICPIIGRPIIGGDFQTPEIKNLRKLRGGGGSKANFFGGSDLSFDSSHIGFDGSRTNGMAVAAQNAPAQFRRESLK